MSVLPSLPERWRIGNYAVVRRISRGGFGEVYEGLHIYLRSKAAIKILHKLDPKAKEELYNEGCILSRISHPNVVAVLDFGEYKDPEGQEQFYLVMALHRESMFERYHLETHTPVPLNESLELIKQVGLGLARAHAHGVVHCDVKPSNILMTSARPTCALADFGLARRSMQRFTNRAVGGTPEYMAPELAYSNHTTLSDLYSLGTLAYQLLAGHLPYYQTGQYALASHAAADAPGFAKGLRVPPEVEAVILQALARTPERRHPNVPAFLQALEEAARTAQEREDAERISQKLTALQPVVRADVARIRTAVLEAIRSKAIPADRQRTVRMPKRFGAITLVLGCILTGVIIAMFAIALQYTIPALCLLGIVATLVGYVAFLLLGGKTT